MRVNLQEFFMDDSKKQNYFCLQPYHRNTPDVELINDLKKVAEKLNKSPTIDEYNEHGKYHATTLTRRFGGWLKSLGMADLEETRSPLNIPIEDLLKNIEEVWVKLGRQPKYNEMLKPVSKYSAGTYDKRFGSWRKALLAFIDFMENEMQFVSNTEKELVAYMPKKHKTKRNINWRLRYLVMRRDNFKCQSCGRSPATDPGTILHVDHITAWASGGETLYDNLQTLCSVCNIGKSNL